MGIDGIHYEGSIYRPPSEAGSLILQATIGCTHNRCAFCVAYQGKRFRVRKEGELFEEIDWAAKHYPGVQRVFLADGDAMALSTERMVRVLNHLYGRFAHLERVTAYASPMNLLNRTPEELRPVRMQLELLKPEMVQKRLGVESTIVIFGSARIPAPEAAARALAALK